MDIHTFAKIARATNSLTWVAPFARLLPEGHLLRRCLDFTDSMIYPVRYALERSLAALREQSHIYNNALLLNIIREHGTRLAIVNGLTLGEKVELWRFGAHHAWFSSGETSFVSDACPADLHATAAAMLLAAHGTERLRLSGDTITPDTAPVSDAVSSDTRDLIETLRAELDVVSCRSVLLYGPPGSGKTTAARQIARAFGTSIVSVDLTGGGQGLGSFTADATFGAIEAWGPDVVLMDDIDHALGGLGTVHLLAGLDRIRARTRLIIGTANVTDALAGAVLRPERFDHVVRVGSPAESLALAHMPHVPRDVQDAALQAGLLMAYVRELDLRCRTGANPADALAHLIERQERSGDGGLPASRSRSALP